MLKCLPRHAPFPQLFLLTAAALWLTVANTTSALAEPPGVLHLSDPWRIAAGDDPAWAEPNFGATDWRQLALPTTWEQLELVGHDGPVWLRQSVRLPPALHFPPSGLALLLGPGHYGAYEIFAGGERIGSLGGPGLRLPLPTAQMIPIPRRAVDTSGVLTLAIRFDRVAWLADRHRDDAGPFGQRLLLGDRETLNTRLRLQTLRAATDKLPAIILVVLFLTVGISHLLLFLHRRSSYEYLWFGLSAINYAAITFLWFWPAVLTARYGVHQRLSGFFLHLSFVLLIQFLWPYLERPIERPLRIYQRFQLGLAVVVLLSPSVYLVVVSAPLRWIAGVPFFVAMGALIFFAVKRGNPDARTIGPACLAVIVTGLVEMVYQVLSLDSTFPLPAWAFALFVLAMAFALSERFNRLHNELDALRLRLEQMVDDRTMELSATNRKLEAEIAERQMAAEAMHMLERAVEQSIDGIAVTDMTGSTQFINRAWAEMHGYEVFQILGHHLSLFHSREQMQETMLPFIEKVKEKGAHQGEVEHRRKDGTLFPTWMSITLLQDAGKGAVGFVAFARDITERRKASAEQLRLEAKVQQAEKLESLGALAAGIAHDYNNLLTGVLGNANLARRELPTNSELQARMGQIEAAAERAAELTDQLLTYAGEDQLIVRELDLTPLLESVVETPPAEVPEHISLHFRGKDQLPAVRADPAQIRRLLHNLITNAVDAIGSGAESGRRDAITLRSGRFEADRDYLAGAFPNEDQPEGTYVYIEVSDTGSGMDEETRAKIFDPFFTTKAAGRGLGLATVLGVVRRHHGAIKIYSKPQRGTTIRILLPVEETLPTTAPAPLRTPAVEWKGGGTILVVDDEDLVREVSKNVFAQNGLRVLTAESGRRAVEIYRQHGDEITLILLDLTMPDLDGIKTFRAIRGLDPEALVILMSGYKEQESIRELTAEGLAGFLQKPFRPAGLMHKLREVMEASL